MEVQPGLLIPAQLDDHMVAWCFEGNMANDAAFEFSLTLIRTGDTVFDVGANIGLWSMRAASNTGPSGTLYAFEPDPNNFARLEANLRSNGISHARCRQVALSNVSGNTTFYLASNGNSGGSALAQREGVDQPIQVMRTTLDQFCEEHSVSHIDILKIDVEGAELLVFRGAERTLRSPRAPIIFFEVIDKLTAPFGYSSADVKALLQSCGYGLYRYEAGRLHRVSSNEYDHHEDLFALKPFHLDRAVACAL